MPDERAKLVDPTRILSLVRHRIGLNDEVHAFDEDLIMEINTALDILTQLGVGSVKGFSISGEEETWDQFIPTDDPRYNMVKTYLAARARLKFDPPQSSYLVDALKQDVTELEWRLSVQNDHTFPTE